GGKTTTTADGRKSTPAAACGNGGATGARCGRADGASSANAAGAGPKAAPPKTVTTKSGATARVNPNGHVSSIHTAKGATISKNAHGGRTVTSEHVNAKSEHNPTHSTRRGARYV